jgi:heme/copper-type cytochrome/quinol oxidase subunit 2
MKRFLGTSSHIFVPIKPTEESSLSSAVFILIFIAAITGIVAILMYIVFRRHSSKRD